MQYNSIPCNAMLLGVMNIVSFVGFVPPPTNNLRPLLRNFFPLPTVVAADCWHHLILATAAVISSMLISFPADDDADDADIDDEGGDLDVSWSWSEEGLRQWVRTSTSIVVIRHHLDAQQQAFFFRHQHLSISIKINTNITFPASMSDPISAMWSAISTCQPGQQPLFESDLAFVIINIICQHL